MDESKEEAKRRKKEAKDQIKQLKQQQKENKKEISRIKTESGQSKMAPVLTFVFVVLFILILLALIKMDVGGFGSNVLGPIIGDIPYVNKILPESAQQEVLPGLLPEETTEAPTTEAPTTEEATTEAKKEKKKKKKTTEAEEDASGSGSSASSSKKNQVDPTIQMYVETYEAMEPATAASILEGMEGDFDLVARILVNMDASKRAEILANMSTNNATKISKIMQSQR